MKTKAVLFFADGFEEMEAIAPLDLLRRADIEVVMVSVSNKLEVVGAHNIEVKCDVLLADLQLDGVTVFVLPGGPGHRTLGDSKRVCDMLVEANNKGFLLAAICAAPSILGKLDILNDRRACCFPGFEGLLSCKDVVMNEPTVTDGNIITSRGAGTAFLFGIAIVEYLFGKEKAMKLSEQTIYMK